MCLSEVSSLCVHNFGSAFFSKESERASFGVVLWEV